MNFEEVIEKLYSSDDELICETLNEGLHASQIGEMDDAISTGFQCKSHKGTIFDVFYLISHQKVCYFKSSFVRTPIGIFCKFDPYSRLENNYSYYTSGFSRSEEYYHTWNDSYDIETAQFNRIEYKEVKKDDNGNVVGFILDNDVNVSSFLIHKNHLEQRRYPLFSAYIPVLYKSDVFSPCLDNTCEKENEDLSKEENGPVGFAYDPEAEVEKQIALGKIFIKLINASFKVGTLKFKDICLKLYEKFDNNREELAEHFDKIKGAYSLAYGMLPEEQKKQMTSPDEANSITIDDLFVTPASNISNLSPNNNNVRSNLTEKRTSNISNAFHHNSYETDDQPTYEKYRGTYAQEVEGCDDDFIDDVLGGEPEAYWNID